MLVSYPTYKSATGWGSCTAITKQQPLGIASTSFKRNFATSGALCWKMQEKQVQLMDVWDFELFSRASLKCGIAGAMWHANNSPQCFLFLEASVLQLSLHMTASSPLRRREGPITSVGSSSNKADKVWIGAQSRLWKAMMPSRPVRVGRLSLTNSSSTTVGRLVL